MTIGQDKTKDGRRRVSPLGIAWVLLFALLGGTAAWLYLNAGETTQVVAGVPRILAPIPPAPPPAKAEVAQTPPAPTPAPETAPPAATPPPAAESPQAPPPAPPEQKTAEAPPPPSPAPAPSPPAEAKPETPPPPPPAAAPAPAEAPSEQSAAKPAAPEAPKAQKEEKPKEEKAAPEAKEQAAAPKPPEKTSEKAAAEKEKPAEAKPAPETKQQVAQLPVKPPAEEAPPAPVKPPAEESKPVAGPDPALLERGREGMLPTIAPDGRQPWQVYARPFDLRDRRPRIAVVIDELGLSSAATDAAIQRLPGGVTLAFSPYARDLDRWTNLARAAGHEVFLNLPMEPIDYPDQDPGPYALLTSIDPKQNLFRMDWLLSRASAYAGVTNHMGSRFTTSRDDLRPVLESIKQRGLMFLDSRSSDQSVAAKVAKEIGMPMAYNNRFIDAEASRDAIDKNLADVERIARRTGYAVAMGSAYPVTIERLVEWLPKAEERGFAIAPVTALAGKQEVK